MRECVAAAIPDGGKGKGLKGEIRGSLEGSASFIHFTLMPKKGMRNCAFLPRQEFAHKIPGIPARPRTFRREDITLHSNAAHKTGSSYTGHLKKAFPRLHDSASDRGVAFTQPRKTLFEGLCSVSPKHRKREITRDSKAEQAHACLC